MKHITQLIILIFSILIITSCKKDEDNDPVEAIENQKILSEFSANIAFASYTELAAATANMHQHIQSFRANPTANGLTECRNDWKAVRKIWEQSEAYLFGPAATDEIDPRIDTWPVNFNDLEVIINGGAVLNESYINNLDDALKGFHPSEYLLWGLNGTKTHLDFTAREFEYLEALSLNLVSLTSQLALGWNPSLPTSFYNEFSLAGIGSTVFASRKAAFEEMVSALAGICDEVANGKINEPFVAQDPSLEESPFSQNSLIDFTNNIKGVQNVYLGKYVIDGAGLENFVRSHNLSLDATIKLQIGNALAALNNISEPFGTAIISQPIQVQNAVDAINELKATLEGEVLLLVQLHAN
jgi:putative iron-regulated protein